MLRELIGQGGSRKQLMVTGCRYAPDASLDTATVAFLENTLANLSDTTTAPYKRKISKGISDSALSTKRLTSIPPGML